jgi:hypothetical protein
MSTAFDEFDADLIEPLAAAISINLAKSESIQKIENREMT